jgi:hypothetical protein
MLQQGQMLPSKQSGHVVLPHWRAIYEALNGRSETDSETEQGGSGMNGRRRS